MAPRWQSRTRGQIEALPSGSLRVKVYAGVDPVSGRRHFLTEVVPAGPRAERRAERVRTRLLAQVDDRRNPGTSATVVQLLERHLELLEAVPTTKSGYAGYVTIATADRSSSTGSPSPATGLSPTRTCWWIAPTRPATVGTPS